MSKHKSEDYTLCNGQTLNIFLLSKIGILNLQGCKCNKLSTFKNLNY